MNPSKLQPFLAALAACAFLVPSLGLAGMVDVIINTSALDGVEAQLGFDLTNGDPTSANTFMVNNFNSDGGLGAANIRGGVAGTLPGSVSIQDGDFLNELLQGITLGNQISFTLDFSENFGGGSPDEFSLFLFDSNTLSPLPLFNTTDPTGSSALFVIDLNGAPGGDLIRYTGDSGDPRPQATWSVSSTQVPEPMILWLWAASAGGWWLAKRR